MHYRMIILKWFRRFSIASNIALIMERKRNHLILLSIWVFSLFVIFQCNSENRLENKEFSDIDVERNISSVNSSSVQTSNLVRTCEPRRKIGFLKMHKCASTTLQNIFLRYAQMNDLNVILPLERKNYVGSPELFSIKLVENTPWHGLGYDMMALHTRWNHIAIKQALGGNPAFVTIIREPVEQFESLYDYYNFFGLHGNLSLSEFLNNPKEFELVRKWGIIGKNQMLFDLGFPVSDFDNEDKVRQFVEEVEKNFDLVMVAEKFEESIVLLKHLLCWDYRDLSFLKLNSREENSKQKLTVDQADKLRKWEKGDNFLYTTLRDVFAKKVEKFGYKRMEEEKRRLSLIREKIIERCLPGKHNLTGPSIIDKMRTLAGCRLYALNEFNMLDVVKSSQWKRADMTALESHGQIYDGLY